MAGADLGLKAAHALDQTPCGHSEGRKGVFLLVLEISELRISLANI